VHRVVLVAIDGDGIGKEVTKQQGVDGEKADQHRRNGQQHQGQESVTPKTLQHKQP
jgi:isocitrate/isopropylmalate dehydrogenase